MRPLIRSYNSGTFLKESKTVLSFLRSSLLTEVFAREDRDWIFVNRSIKSAANNWMPKLYVCLQPKDYWPVVALLVGLSQKYKFSWKFCKNLKLFSRPDKIVIYAKGKSDLKRILRVIRPTLKGRAFHGLAFASTTVQSGLEKTGGGIFVGCDPLFLKNSSWRYYRWMLEECVIKPNLKNGKLGEDVKKALKVCNVTLRHSGPKTLMPLKKNNKFIKQLWAEIQS